MRSEVALSAGDAYSGFSLAGSREHTDGILAFNNEFSNDVLSAAARVASGNGTDARVTMRWSASAYHFPTDYTGAVVDRNSEQSDHRFVASVEGGQRLGDVGDFRISLVSNEFLPRSNDGPDDATRPPLGSMILFACGPHTAPPRRGSTCGTVRAVSSPWAARSQPTASGVRPCRSASSAGTRAGSQPTVTTPAGTPRHCDATGRFSYSVGGASTGTGVRVVPDGRASIAYLTSSTTRVRASIGSAFKAPSFFENSCHRVRDGQSEPPARALPQRRAGFRTEFRRCGADIEGSGVSAVVSRMSSSTAARRRRRAHPTISTSPQPMRMAPRSRRATVHRRTSPSAPRMRGPTPTPRRPGSTGAPVRRMS